MAQRAALPAQAVTLTPGYSWRLDLDLSFDGERPSDWEDWVIRMHIWGPDFPGLTLTNGSGVTVEPISGLPGATGPVTIPVIRLTKAMSESLRSVSNIQYVIDLKAPGGEAEDYFAGPLFMMFAPPAGLLS